jgi:hypothetical protein
VLDVTTFTVYYIYWWSAFMYELEDETNAKFTMRHWTKIQIHKLNAHIQIELSVYLKKEYSCYFMMLVPVCNWTNIGDCNIPSVISQATKCHDWMGVLMLHIQVTLAILTNVSHGFLQIFQANDWTLSQIKPTSLLGTFKHSGSYNLSFWNKHKPTRLIMKTEIQDYGI